jgi:hypothetical protein
MIHRVDVFHLTGQELVTTAEALATVVRQRTDGGSHLEIAPHPSSHPLMTLIVQDSFAVLHFFGSVDDPGWQSRGNLHAVRAVVEFPDPTGSVMTLPGAAVIDLVTAERCVTAFAESLSRPELVEWMRL